MRQATHIYIPISTLSSSRDVYQSKQGLCVTCIMSIPHTWIINSFVFKSMQYNFKGPHTSKLANAYLLRLLSLLCWLNFFVDVYSVSIAYIHVRYTHRYTLFLLSYIQYMCTCTCGINSAPKYYVHIMLASYMPLQYIDGASLARHH